MRVLCLQIDSSYKEEPLARMNRVLKLLNDTPRDVQLVILPEHWIAGAFNLDHEVKKMADIYSNFLNEARSIAVEKGILIHSGSGLYSAKNNRFQNTSFILTPNNPIDVSYSKVHPFRVELGGITGGVELISLRVFNTSVSPLICYDLRFPESFRGRENFSSEIYIIAAAWPSARIDTWVHLLKSRAIENQAYVLGVNGVGSQQQEILGGRSSIFSPDGTLLSSAGIAEEFFSFDLDLDHLRSHRMIFPYLSDAKIISQSEFI